MPPFSLNIIMPILFLLVLYFVIKPPKLLSIAAVSGFGSLLTILLGFVKLNDLNLVITTCWDAILTLIGLMLISINLEANGYFTWLAKGILKLAKNNGFYLLILLSLLTSITAAILANDGAVLIMTPLTFAITKVLNLKNKTAFVYLFTVGFLCDAASTPLLASNLTNILIADAFSINYLAYARKMLLPTIAIIISTLGVILLIFKSNIPHKFDSPETIYTHNLPISTIIFSSLILIALLLEFILASFFCLPIAFIVIPSALILAIFNHKFKYLSYYTMAKKIDWSIIIFALSLFIIIVGLFNSHYLDFIKTFFYLHKRTSLANNFSLEIFLSILSSIFNNLPACLISIITLKHLDLTNVELNNIAYISIFGTNIGSKLLPYGSLSTMLWLDILKEHGYGIGWKTYFIYSIPLTIICLIIGGLIYSFN